MWLGFDEPSLSRLCFGCKEKTMAEETIFSKIIRHEIPSDIVYQDEQVSAFRDISPRARVHVLIVPNKVIPTVNVLEPQD